MTSTEQSKQSPQSHPDFVFEAAHYISTLNTSVQEFTHTLTGAKHFHLANDDPHKVFMVAFRTVPSDDTGIAHILEHTALCGSKRFPVRDPFFMMIRRSLNTFMNAFTSSDWTAYPFATLNDKDFDNLLRVYLDAAFFPNLHALDFAQEGHRLEFKDINNPDAGLEYKGVVFNEMKGAMSSITSTLWQRLTHHLFPTNTYHYNSGGEPEAILDLTHQQLVAFHAKHYHPSNAIFITYGNQAASDLQEKFQTLALSDFDTKTDTVLVDDEADLGAEREVRDYYATSDEDIEQACHYVMAWKLPHSADIKNLLRAELLSIYLLDNSASPMMHLLETTELAKSPSPICGLENDMKEIVLAFGVQGIAEHDIAELRQRIDQELERISNSPIDHELLDAILHQLELNQRVVSSGPYPYGLQMALGLLPSALHGGTPLTALDLDKTLDELRAEIQDENFIQSLIKKWLLDNTHRISLTLVPSLTLNQEKQTQEQQRLDGISLSNEEAQTVIAQTKALTARQAEVGDSEMLPKVTLEDVPKDIRDVPAVPVSDLNLSNSAFPIYCYKQPTNGISYTSLYIELPQLTSEEQRFFGLFCGYLTEVGSAGQDYRQTQLRYSAKTGGINAGFSINSKLENLDETAQYFVLSAKALNANQASMEALMLEVLTTVDFSETDRIKDLLFQSNASNLRGIAGSGHVYAMQTAERSFSKLGQFSYESSGLEYIYNHKQLVSALEDTRQTATLLANICDCFRSILEKLLSSTDKRVFFCRDQGEGEQFEQAVQLCERSWQTFVLPEANQKAVHVAFSLDDIKTNHARRMAWLTNVDVNYCAMSFPAVNQLHADAPKLDVLSAILRNGYLHSAIREQGGAYGSGAKFNSNLGTFSFMSYRDPRLFDTYDDFMASKNWLMNTKDRTKVDEAILNVISRLDNPNSPSGEANSAFKRSLMGMTMEMRLTYRKSVLDTTLAELKQVAETYLNIEQSNWAVVSGQPMQDLLEKNGFTIKSV